MYRLTGPVVIVDNVLYTEGSRPKIHNIAKCRIVRF